MKSKIREELACEIFLTTFCNLKCDYCIAGGMEKEHMKYKTGKDVVDFFMNLGSGAKSIEYSFTGGEPLLGFPIMRKIILYAKRKAAKKNIDTSFTIKTNGTILKKEMISFFKRHNINLFISIDGLKETHDKFRIGRSIKRTHNIVVNNIQKLVYNNISCVASMTIHPDSIKYVPDNIRFLSTLGVNHIDIGPAYGTVKWSKVQSRKLAEMFKEVGKIIIELEKNNIPIIISPLYRETDHIKSQLKNCWGCGSTTTNMAFMPNGNISGCSALAMVADKFPELILGNIYSGIDEALLENMQKYCQADLSSRKKCIKCKSADNCSGGCVAMNLSQFGKPMKLPEFYCNLISVIPEIWETVWGKKKVK